MPDPSETNWEDWFAAIIDQLNEPSVPSDRLKKTLTAPSPWQHD